MYIEEQIAELIHKYEREANKKQSEADVRANYIDWLFYYLGWDVWKQDPHPITSYHREGYVRDAGFVDIGLENTRACLSILISGFLCFMFCPPRFF